MHIRTCCIRLYADVRGALVWTRCTTCTKWLRNRDRVTSYTLHAVHITNVGGPSNDGPRGRYSMTLPGVGTDLCVPHTQHANEYTCASSYSTVHSTVQNRPNRPWRSLLYNSMYSTRSQFWLLKLRSLGKRDAFHLCISLVVVRDG